MKMIGLMIMLIGFPMAITELLYRIVDRKGNKTAKLVERFPVLQEKKFVIQILGTFGFELVFGGICWLTGIPLAVFFVVSGVVLGFINGMAITIMHFD